MGDGLGFTVVMLASWLALSYALPNTTVESIASPSHHQTFLGDGLGYTVVVQV